MPPPAPKPKQNKPSGVVKLVRPLPKVEVIPGHILTEKIAMGGCASVFKAVETSTGGARAIKILFPRYADKPQWVHRFLSEGKLLTELSHPHVVKGYGYGTVGVMSYLIMEYFPGSSVQELMEFWGGALSEKPALSVLVQIAKALDYMHSRGLVHRDIKPGNVLVNDVNDKQVAKLCDLGLAAELIGGKLPKHMTAGTPVYMAPEQAKGEGMDARADIYALGGTLFHMVTGIMPVNDPTNPEVRRKAVIEGIKYAEKRYAGLSTAVQYYILRCLAKDPSKRFSKVSHLVKEMQMYLDGMRTFTTEARELLQGE